MMTANSTPEDTIVALATAQGRGAIGIVRLSGSRVLDIAGVLCGADLRPRVATLKTVRDADGEAYDQAIVIYYPAPRSYTGEPMLEIQTHGGPAVIDNTLQTCIKSGARLARPGEFSERAFLNDKIDLLQAEAIADLIVSGSERAARSAYRSMTGEFSREVNDIVAALKQARIALEAYIDFPDEDVPNQVIADICALVAEHRNRIETAIDAARIGERLGRGLDVAIVGRPNAGKSTLLNALARQERAITSEIPGTTRDVVTVDTDYAGLALRFHDTAGIRTSVSDAIEAEGVRRSKTAAAAADITLYVSDDWDEQPPEELINGAGQFVFVLNKIDLSTAPAGRARWHDKPSVRVSAKTGAGIDSLIGALVEFAGLSDQNASILLARERHISGLKSAAAALELAPATVRESPELAAEQLRVAQVALGELTGEYSSEDLLGDIFSTFCIGK